MSIIKALFKNKLFLAGLLIPVIWQLLYFSIVIPAMNDAETRTGNMTVSIVNQDPLMGKQIAAQLNQALPFTTKQPANLDAALEAMNDGEASMVIAIPSDFTDRFQQGEAGISYYINQAAPNTTKQLMETAAINIDRLLNENAFYTMRDAILENAADFIGQSGLPPQAIAPIGSAMEQALGSLKGFPVAADIRKVNDAEGFIKTSFPLFIFLTFFVGSVFMTIARTVAAERLADCFSRSRIFGVSLGIDIVYSLVVSWIVIAFAAGFGIDFSQELVTVWLLLAAGFFTFLSLFQMFGNWLGRIGTGLAALVLFPIQLISSGMMFPRELLPSFYNAVGDYLPATYFSTGITRIFYGDLSISDELGVMLIMASIFVLVTALALLKKSKNKAEATIAD